MYLIENSYPDLGGYMLFVRQIKSSHLNNEQKPVLVFLHDSWGCTEMWNNFPEKLVELSGLNAMIYDRRGYGKSSPFCIVKRTNRYLHDEAEELIRLLDILKIKTAVLYGHSDGATIALIAAALYPDRIAGLIVEGPHSFIEESGKEAVRHTRERSKSTGLLNSLEKYHGGKTEKLFRLWHETWLSEEFSIWTIVPLLSKIRIPVLAFQGENDEFGTIEQLNVLKKEIPEEVFVTEIPGAGHTPRKEAEKETMEWIKNYFARFIL